MTDDHDPDKHSWHDDTPFPRRWKGYTALKIAILVLALVLAVYLLGLM
jgi:hypothetical protein